ncbi:MAG: FkbM family methyltransferase [Bacteroidia bacterium]
MKHFLANSYTKILARKRFRRFNTYLVKIGLKGLGLLYSHEDPKRNGESFFMKKAIYDFKVSGLFDVGANKGNYTKLFMELGYTKDIHCFEPHPTTFKYLVDAISTTQVKKFNIAFSRESGTFPIFDYAAEDGSEHASLFKDVIEKVHKSNATSYQVEVRTIDEFVETNKIDNIGLLKIDTEGNEYNVLLGAQASLKNNKISLIHFEFNEMNVVSRVFLKDFFSLLHGFNLYRLLPNDFLPLQYDHSLLNELFSYQNIIAVRKDLDTVKGA